MGKRRGQALIELAITVIVIMFAFSFMLDLWDQLDHTMIVMSATREGARWGSRQSRDGATYALNSAVWRACLYLEQAGTLPPGNSCPTSPDSVSHGRWTSPGLIIEAGWINGPVLKSSVSNMSLPGGPPREQKERVPIYVAIEMRRKRLVGMIPGQNTYVIRQQTTLMMDQ